MKVLVTGGGGFLGSAIVRRLHERGDAVTAFGRSRYPHLEELGLRTVHGDVRDAAAVAEAVRSVDLVIHTAALAGIWGPRRLYWAINVEGTRNVMRACRQGGVGRLVYTSSPSVIFGPGEQCGVDESVPYPDRYLAHYPESKAVAEQEILAANDGTLATVALRPHLIWGPGDPHLIPRVVDRARAGRLRQVGDGSNRVDLTYIDNAAEAHVCAVDALRPGAACAGRAYFISQAEPVALWPWINNLLSELKINQISKVVSPRMARMAGLVAEWLFSLPGVRGEPPMTRFLALQLAQSHYFDITAARRDLGYEPQVSMKAGLERLLASWAAVPGPLQAGPEVVRTGGVSSRGDSE